jgi:hypothetical protein
VNFGIFNHVLYATTFNPDDGLEIWRSCCGDGYWVHVVVSGRGDADNTICTDLTEFDGHFYAAIENENDGAEIWRSEDGVAWYPLISGGFGDTNNTQSGSLTAFDGYLYASTRNDVTGAQLWRFRDSTTGWTRVVPNGFGDRNNVKIESLAVLGDTLFVGTANDATGIEIWTWDGTTWKQVNVDGFGDEDNIKTLWSIATAVFNGDLYVGTTNRDKGGEIWKWINRDFQVFLPFTSRNHAAPTMRAVTFGGYYEPGNFERYLEGELDKIAKLGANQVGLAYFWFMSDRHASELHPAPSTWEPGQYGTTHSEQAVRMFANEAHARGLEVDISLQVACHFGLSNCWSGSIHPTDQAAWDDSYINAYVVPMSELAQELGVERLSIANELTSMQQREDFMLELIRRVRQVYDGEVMISLAMWSNLSGGKGDGEGYQNVPLSVLRAVDNVGLNLYVRGSTDGNATLEEMIENMIPQMDSVAAYYHGLGIYHLSITEAGASIMDGGSVIPWLVVFSDDTPMDLQEQADYYAAYFQALERSKLGPMLSGVMFWAWDIAGALFEDGNLKARRLSISRSPLVHRVLAEQCSISRSPLVHRVLAEQWGGKVSLLAPLSLEKSAMPDYGLHQGSFLTYTLTLSGPGLNVRLWDPLPPSVHYVSGSLDGTVTPTAVYSPPAQAVLWQGTLPTDTVRQVRFQVTPTLTGLKWLSLSWPIVNTAWLTDTHSGIGVTATVAVNGGSLYLPLARAP